MRESSLVSTLSATKLKKAETDNQIVIISICKMISWSISDLILSSLVTYLQKISDIKTDE